jgi:hypothetical protein
MSTTTQTGAPDRIEMTMMYAIHEAFQRDLGRLAAAAGGEANTGSAIGPAVWACWERFKYFLRVHHTAERTNLWPLLRERAAGQPALMALLEQMDYERIGLIGLLDAVDAALTTAVPGQAEMQIERLAPALAVHGRHEESLARQADGLLTDRERDEFTWEQRRLLGFQGAASFYPWLLDGAPDDVRRAVLSLEPPPIRLLYRTLWHPRYVHGPRWHAAA